MIAYYCKYCAKKHGVFGEGIQKTHTKCSSCEQPNLDCELYSVPEIRYAGYNITEMIPQGSNLHLLMETLSASGITFQITDNDLKMQVNKRVYTWAVKIGPGISYEPDAETEFFFDDSGSCLGHAVWPRGFQDGAISEGTASKSDRRSTEGVQTGDQQPVLRVHAKKRNPVPKLRRKTQGD